MILSTYIPLIHFLHRPDLSSSFYAPSPKPSLSILPLSTSESESIPPWERLSIPDLNTFEKGSSVGMGLGYPAFGSGGVGSLEVTIGARVGGGGFVMPEEAIGMCEGGHKAVGHRGSHVSEMTLVHPSEGKEQEVDDLKEEQHHDNPCDPKIADTELPEPAKIEDSDTLPPSIIAHPKKARLRPSTASSTVTFSLPPSHQDQANDNQNENENDVDPDISSFRGMLDYPISSASSFRTIPYSRPVTPECPAESMATSMNRRTSRLLCWFPLTVSCGRDIGLVELM
jgi:hypothetical protein